MAPSPESGSDTAFPHRAQGYNLIVLSEWMEPKDNNACIAWARHSYTARSWAPAST